MLLNKIQRCLTITILLLIFNMAPISSAEEQFGISMDCFDSCNNQDMDYSKDIILTLTLKNNLDYWVAIEGGKDGIDLRIEVENKNLENGKDFEIYSDLLGQNFYMQPKDEVKIYIPFKMYNKREGDNRLNGWKIYPELSFDNIYFYENSFKSESTRLFYDNQPFTIKSPITGNALEFNTVKPEVVVESDNSQKIISDDFWDNPFNEKLLFPILVFVIGSIIVYIIIKRK